MALRTHNCGELNKNHIDQTVKLSGWVNSIRTHGQIIFIDLRDRFGKTQIILNSDELIKIGKTLSNEDVVCIEGKVSSRSKDLINPDENLHSVMHFRKVNLQNSVGYKSRAYLASHYPNLKEDPVFFYSLKSMLPD